MTETIFTTKDAYSLIHEGILAFSDMEEKGLVVDVDYCKKEEKRINKKIERLKRQIAESEAAQSFKKRTGHSLNPLSHQDLKILISDVLQLKTEEKTASGDASTRESVLEKIKDVNVRKIIELKKLMKANNTYLKNIIEESVDGIIHPFFNLHNVITYRSSSDHINFQNIPNRNPVIQKLVRQAIIAPEDYILMEADYSSIEVRIAACYHKDKNMISYLKDESKDMHRDTALELFILDEDDWSKESRQCAKNQFVFPQFYGDYYASCAVGIWDYCITNKVTTKSGVPIIEHLKRKGINNLDDFTDHVEKVERHFWKTRFRQYDRWRKEWFENYIKKGYFDSYSGFRYKGIMKKNDVINYPVQGAAFHVLLWSLVRLNKIFKKRKLKSYICGQIHDSIVLYCYKKEYEQVIQLLHKVMIQEAKKKYPWIIVPIGIEVEASPLNRSWYEKGELTKKDCSHCGVSWAYKKKEGCPLCCI